MGEIIRCGFCVASGRAGDACLRGNGEQRWVECGNVSCGVRGPMRPTDEAALDGWREIFSRFSLPGGQEALEAAVIYRQIRAGMVPASSDRVLIPSVPFRYALRDRLERLVGKFDWLGGTSDANSAHSLASAAHDAFMSVYRDMDRGERPNQISVPREPFCTVLAGSLEALFAATHAGLLISLATDKNQQVNPVDFSARTVSAIAQKALALINLEKSLDNESAAESALRLVFNLAPHDRIYGSSTAPSDLGIVGRGEDDDVFEQAVAVIVEGMERL